MAITAYTGVPGTGKSYALVSEIIVPAVRAGRRVLTNVSGVKPDAVVDYCIAKWPDEAEHVGSVVLFDGQKTIEDGFFPAEGDAGNSFVQPGDLLVFDEVRMYWPRRGTKFPPAVMKFLRYHRHFVSSTTHQATDVVLASQLITDFHEDFRGCIERSYKFRKLNSVGLNSRFVWNIWEGPEQRKGHAISRGGGKYRKEIYALYSSYVGGKGSEKATDRRQNILGSPRFMITVVVVVLAAFFAVWGLTGFFKKPADAPIAAAGAAPLAVGAMPAPVAPGASTPGYAGAPPVSSIWRISGSIQTPGLNVVVLVDRSGNVRYESPSNFTMVDGRPYAGTVDGQRVLAIGMQAAASGGASSFFGAPR